MPTKVELVLEEVVLKGHENFNVKMAYFQVTEKVFCSLF